jgi:hypothetical protein
VRRITNGANSVPMSPQPQGAGLRTRPVLFGPAATDPCMVRKMAKLTLPAEAAEALSVRERLVCRGPPLAEQLSGVEGGDRGGLRTQS